MSCNEFIIEQVTKDRYAMLLAMASENGVAISGTQAMAHGCILTWNYYEASQSIHITCTEHPWYASCAEVESKIREIVAKAERGI